MKIDPRHLQQLATIIEAGTFNEAAARLKTTQPALSRMISTLELRIGAPLFERSRRPLMPTEIGRKLAMHGHAISDSTQRATHLVDYSLRGEIGSIKFGVPPFLSEFVARLAISTFLQQRTEVRFQLISDYSADLQNKILAHELDLAICPILTIDTTQRDLRIEPLFESEMIIVCRAGHPLADKTSVTADDLEAATWIGHSDKSHLSVEMQSILIDGGVRKVKLAFLSESAVAIMTMLKETDYLTILPKYAIYDRIVSGELASLKFSASILKRWIGIMMHAHYLPSPLMQFFLDHLHNVMQEFVTLSKSGPRD